MSDQAPIRKQSAVWMRGGLKNRQGTLLLYPDQLHHVGLGAAQIGSGFGALGLIAARASSKAAAEKKVAGGHRSVLSIPLAEISDLRGTRAKLGGGQLLIRTVDGEEYRFGGIRGDEWTQDLARALTAIGQIVAPSQDGFSVATPGRPDGSDGVAPLR